MDDSTIKKRIFVWCGDPYHQVGLVMEGLQAATDCRYEFSRVADGAPKNGISPCDLVVLAKINAKSASDSAPWEVGTSASALETLVENGTGLLVIHGGSAGYELGSSCRKLTGGTFRHHPHPCAVSIEPIGSHPITVGVEPFEVYDEHYFMHLDDEWPIFLTTRSEHGLQPAGWTREIGKGRVCVLTPGHFEKVWTHSQFQMLLRNALQWVTNG
jgi:type 1 glutamine amidotransferase